MDMTIENKCNMPASARRMARVAGVFYIINIVTAMYAYFGPRNRMAFYADIAATVAYVAVTVLFYLLFRPVSRSLSLLAACISMAGSAMGVLHMMHRMPFKIEILVFFSLYCLLIGFLILRSTFLPRILGVLMILAGVGYAAYFWPPLAKQLYPYDVIPGALGEWTLTVWLLVKGVNGERWAEQVRVKDLEAES